MVGNMSRNRTLWWVGAALLLLAVFVTYVRLTTTTTSHLGDLTIVTAAYANPNLGATVSEDVAKAAAIKKIHEIQPTVSGVQFNVARQASGLRGVQDSRGNPIYSNPTGVNAWVLEFSAPAQGGYKFVSGVVVVDSASGTVDSASILLSNT